MKKVMNLCFVYDSDKILLGMKKRGFGAGRWNGFGGKVQEGETIEEAAKRELREEINIEVNTLEKKCIFDFHFPDGRIMNVHVFRILDYSGVPNEGEEMKPQWFKHSEIPYSEMWSDDRLWLPSFLEGKNLRGEFYFDECEKIKNYNFEEVGSF